MAELIIQRIKAIKKVEVDAISDNSYNRVRLKSVHIIAGFLSLHSGEEGLMYGIAIRCLVDNSSIVESFGRRLNIT